VPNAFAELLPFAFGLVLAPLPVAAVVLLLRSSGGTAAAAAFTGAWFGTAAAVAFVVALITSLGADPDRAGVLPGWVALLHLVIGVVMVALAGQAAHRHLRRGAATADAPPAWLSDIGGYDPARAAGLAAALAALNPKNLAMLVGAGAAVGAFGLGAGGALVSALVFALLGTATVAAPLVAALAAGERGGGGLDRVRGWLVEHNDVVTTTVLFVFGGVFLARGLRGVL
jgi:hypothetical protein